MPDVWMAPGGHRDFKEALYECARREVREETGLIIKNLRIKATGCSYLKGLDQEFFFHFVFADYAGGTFIQIHQDGELVWVSPQKMSKLDNLLAEIHKMLPDLFQDGNRILSYKEVYEKGNKLDDFRLENPK